MASAVFASAPVISKESIKDFLSALLWGRSDKEVARAIQGSRNTASNIRNGRTEPEAWRLIRLMREYDEVYEAVIAMAGRKTEALSHDQTILIRQALALIGTALPAQDLPSVSPASKAAPCAQSSSRSTASAARPSLAICRLAAPA
jgi:hypothetical protein